VTPGGGAEDPAPGPAFITDVFWTGAVAMDWWGWLLIAIAAVLVISFLVALPDARRYLRIRRM
jgi:hypothetical protein